MHSGGPTYTFSSFCRLEGGRSDAVESEEATDTSRAGSQCVEQWFGATAGPGVGRVVKPDRCQRAPRRDGCSVSAVDDPGGSARSVRHLGRSAIVKQFIRFALTGGWG